MALYHHSDALLTLLSSLTDKDSASLQIKINNFLSLATSSRVSFLVVVSHEEEALHVHVLGGNCLPARVKLPITTSCFVRSIQDNQPTTFRHLTEEQRGDLFKVLKLLQSPERLLASKLSTKSAALDPEDSLNTTFSPARRKTVANTGVSSKIQEEDSNRNRDNLSSSGKPVVKRKGNSCIASVDCLGSSTGYSMEPKSPLDGTKSPGFHDALLVDSVFTSPTSMDQCDHGFNCSACTKPDSFLCVPLSDPRPQCTNSSCSDDESDNDITPSGLPIVLACLVDKIAHDDFNRSNTDCHGEEEFSSIDSNSTRVAQFDGRDVNLVKECLKYALPVLLTTMDYETERRLRYQYQKMLSIAKNLFARLEDVSSLLLEIMSEARALTDAERCSLFLVDEKKELYAKVFDGQTNDGDLVTASSGAGAPKDNEAADGLLGLYYKSSEREVRLPSNTGIAGHVATTGKLLNIRDAYSHPLFFKGFDEKTGFKTRNLLCFPIFSGEGDSCSNPEVIGVAELCNKMTGRFFTQFDEQLATSFSVFCGIAIAHSLLYNKIVNAHARIKLSNELVMLHMSVTKEEVERLTQQKVPTPSDLHSDFFSFSFFPRVLDETQTPLAVVSMMTHLGLVQKWSIPANTLARFVLMVRKGYRDPPYHNWVHAFSVTHFAFLLINNLRLVQVGAIDDLEALALIASCLCHDLDHRGTTNSFQVDSNSVLASLYSSEGSVMERHHFAQAMCILNTEGCNIFESLKQDDYTRCLDLMRDIILATDLAHHLRHLNEMKQMAVDGYDPNNSRHRHLCICLLMTSADLSDQTKDWDASRSVAKLIYKEFFTQGDLEKAMGNLPLVMMDRDKAFIPELQLSFLDNIALPVYKLVADLFPEANAPYESVLDSYRKWSNVRDLHLHRRKSYASSLDIFDEDLHGA